MPNQVQLSIKSFTMPADPTAERDRQTEVRAARKEQDRLTRARAQELSAAEQQEFIVKFNRLETFHQRIDAIEKSRVWSHRKDAVVATRAERIQYIQAAREVITVFLSNKAFFVKDRWKPYMGGEARSWTYRKDQADPENSGLSGHVVDMAERLSNAMGLNKHPEPEPIPVETEKPALRPPTSYREVPFDTWYIVMIRQAIYLTFEDRFPEALELLMEIHRANVFFVVPRRRSGIMLVTLACAMWAGDYDTVGNASRYLCSFGGIRPFPLRLYQSVFTLGPRGHHKYFAWAQTTTLKYIKRFSDMMREAVGSRATPIARKKTLSKRRAVQGKRVKRTLHHSFARLEQPRTPGKPRKKRQKVETVGTAKNVEVPWTKSVFQRNIAAKTPQDLSASSSPPQDKDQVETTTETLSPTVTAQRIESSHVPLEEPTSSAELGLTRHPSNTNNDAQPATSSLQPSSSAPQSSSSQPQSSENEFTSSAPYGKRKIIEEDEEDVAGHEENEEADEDRGDEEDDDDDEEDEDHVPRTRRGGNYGDMTEAEGFDDEDDYDVQDEAYKTDDDDGELDREEAVYEYGDWEDEEEEFSGLSKHKTFKTTSRRFDTLIDEDQDPDLDDGVAPKKKKGKKSKVAPSASTSVQKTSIPLEVEEEGRKKSRKSFTNPQFTTFSISLIMFHGYLLAASRSHIGAAGKKQFFCPLKLVRISSGCEISFPRKRK